MFASAHFLENFNVPMEQPKARLPRHNNSSIRSPRRNGQLLSPIPDEKAQGGRRGHGKQKKDAGGEGVVVWTPNTTIPAQWASLTVHPHSCRPSLLVTSGKVWDRSSMAIRSVSTWAGGGAADAGEWRGAGSGSGRWDHEQSQGEGADGDGRQQGEQRRVTHFLPDMFRNQQATGRSYDNDAEDDMWQHRGDGGGYEMMSPGGSSPPPSRTMGSTMTDAQVHAHLRGVSRRRMGLEEETRSKVHHAKAYSPTATQGDYGGNAINVAPHRVSKSEFLAQEPHTVEERAGTGDTGAGTHKDEEGEREEENVMIITPTVLMRLPIYQSLMKVPSARSETDITLIAQLLAASPVLHLAPENVPSDLARVVKCQLYGPGQCIVREKEKSEEYVIILTGSVKVVNHTADGVEKEINRLGPGEAFGELGMLLRQPRSSTCIACSKTGVLCAVVMEPDYNRILSEYHTVTNKYHELFVF